MRIVGLDMSLTGTGVAVLERDELTGETMPPRTLTLKSKGKAGDDLLTRGYRVDLLRQDVALAARYATFVIIEQPAFSQTGGSHHDRSGLWWLVVRDIQRLGIPVVEVAPTTLKKYVTGKGNASKMEVMAKMIRLMPQVEIANDNEADALALALMGARRYATALEPSLPLVNLEAMEKVRWP